MHKIVSPLCLLACLGSLVSTPGQLLASARSFFLVYAKQDKQIGRGCPQGIFAAAKAAAPAIIFMDEVDSIAVAREGGSARSGAGHGGGTASGDTSDQS